MARSRRVAYRKRHQNKFSMFLVSLVVLMILVVVAIRGIALQEKVDAKLSELQLYEEQIAAQEERADEIELFRKEVNTLGYAERIAREKLNFLYEDEIMLKPEP